MVNRGMNLIDSERRRINMAKINVAGFGEFEVPNDKRLVLALVDEAGVDQLHACGGNGRCTTCQVRITDGETGPMTDVEQATLTERGLEGVRLSCQILCEQDLSVEILKRLSDTDREDAGNRPADVMGT